MFSDSRITKGCLMQRDKICIKFRFGTIFFELTEKIKKSLLFSISFDESLNDQLEKKNKWILS